MGIRQFNSLRGRLVGIVLLCLIPGLIVVLYVTLSAHSKARQRAVDETIAIAHVIAFDHERLVGETRQFLSVLSQVPEVVRGDRAETLDLFQKLVRDHARYSNLGLADLAGTVTCSAIPLSQPVNIADRSYFRRALTQQQFAVGDFQVGRITGRPGVNFGQPIEDATGRTTGVLYAAVDLAWLNETASTISLPPSASVTVIDAKGTILVRHPDSNSSIGETLPLFVSSLPKTSGVIETSQLDGRPQIIGVSSLRGDAGVLGYVLVSLPKAALFSQAKTDLQLSLLILAIAASLALVIAWIGSRRAVLRPIERLSRSMNRIRAGELTARTNAGALTTELQGLATAFNEMAESLEHHEIEVREAQAALTTSQSLFESFMSHLPAVAFIKDAEGRFQFVNQSFCDVFQAGREDIRGKTDFDLFPETAAAQNLTNDHAVLSSGNTIEVTEIVPLPDGTERTWFVVKFPIYQDSGPPLVGGIALDVTERELLEAQLRQSQKLEAMGHLAGGVAHDFNNILTAIQGFGDLALEHLEINSRARRNVEEMRRSADRAAALTRQLLAFSRKQPVTPKVVEVNDVVQGIGAMLRRLVGEHMELQIALDPSAGRVEIDPGQLEQILANLVVNARDAMPTGGQLTIETGRVELDESYEATHPGVRIGSYSLLSITDTGTGMDQETMARIFEPFFTTKEQGKGTGLGLSTVYGIAKQYGGDIRVYSELGHGTTFRVYLPSVEAAAAPQAIAHQQIGDLTGHETVLVVDDDEQVRLLVAQVLESHGYRVLSAAHAGEALETASVPNRGIDLLVSDLVMPQVSGPELASRLLSDHPAMSVLFISGYAEQGMLRRGALSAKTSFLPKPFGAHELTRRVRELLDDPASQAA